ncbi:MAG: MarR family transcriptional regulator [Calditrichaeota bacterium]|nr:MAG: MarR family transcriptional regulator [Calditrichota bacterium]
MITLKERIQQKKFDRPGQEALVGLLYTTNLLRNELQAICKAHDITLAQFNILRILKGVHPKGHPRYAIQERLVERAPDITRMLDRMMILGWVDRRPGSTDRRLSFAYITKSGIRLLEEVNKEIDAYIEQFEETLGKEDIDALIRVTNAIIEKF